MFCQFFNFSWVSITERTTSKTISRRRARSEISIDTIYPGASSSIIETKITEIIEAQISGIDGIESVSSVSRDGRSKVTIEFADKNIDEAANDVRDSVSRILENLPKDSNPPEISKIDSDSNAIMWLNLISDDINQLELTDYAERYLMIDYLSSQVLQK